MVLAAGRGARMRPLSEVLPKPALPLPHGPVVSSALRLAAAAGSRHLVINTCHLADRMERALRSITPIGDSVSLSREEQLMGTAGGLALARDRGLLGTDGAVLVVNGDSVVDLPLDPLIERFESSRDLVSLALLRHPDPSRWANVILSGTGLVTEIRPPGTAAANERHFLYPGVMLVSRAALDAIPTVPLDTPEALWQPARLAGRLGGVPLEGSWREVGTPADYVAAVRHQLGGTSLVDSTAVVSEQANLTVSYVGPHARVGDGSAVEDSVLACGARVDADSRITRSVLLGPVEIGVGETVTDEVRVAPLREDREDA